eukprot:COSAG02_NODE_37896_length_436_cov_0.715134_1_plen_83_part_10
MIIPEAAAGHFVRVEWPEDFAGIVPDYDVMTLEELAKQYHQCMPFEACVGDCEKDRERGNYDACEGAFDETRSEDCSDLDAPN